jgi:hypothetical protein
LLGQAISFPFSQQCTGIESGSSFSVSCSKVNVLTRGLECSTLGLTIYCWGFSYSGSSCTNSVLLVKGIIGC